VKKAGLEKWRRWESNPCPKQPVLSIYVRSPDFTLTPGLGPPSGVSGPF